MSDKPIRTIRTPHTKDRPYFSMNRDAAQDRTLSWEARGVLAYLLSKPDDWVVQPSDLEQNCGRNRVYRILAELRKTGYLTLNIKRDDKGKIQVWEYLIREEPLPQKQEVDEQEVGNGDSTKYRRGKSRESVVSKKRERNPLFDAVALHVFEIDAAQMPGEVDQDGGRMGAITAWLSGKSDGLRRGKSKLTVGFISKSAEPKHVEQFAREYRQQNPTISLPKDFEKFVEAWRKWASSKSRRPARPAAPLPEAEAVTPEQRAELKQAMNDIKPAWKNGSDSSHE